MSREETVHQHIEVLAQHEVCIETFEFLERGSGAAVWTRLTQIGSAVTGQQTAFSLSPGVIC
jgi:hypothetical protein